VTRYLMFFEGTPGGLRVPRELLVEHLKCDWPGVRFVPDAEMGQSEMRDVGWYVSDGDEILEGWSSRSGVGITLDGDDELVARFASWYRRLVPEDVEVTFADSGYYGHVVVPPGASAEAILRLYHEVP
jgi:hypothetical protein